MLQLTGVEPKIVYTTIVGAIMLMICLEWILWLAAFVYCLVKVFQKAEHWSVKALCIIVGVAFVLLRYDETHDGHLPC